MKSTFNTAAKFFLLAIFTCVNQSSFAQSNKHGLGIQGGAFSHEGNLQELSFTGGLFYDYKFGQRFGINFASLYRQRHAEGFSYAYSENMADPPMVKVKIHYFEIPVNFSLNLNKRPEASWKTNLLVGGTYSYYMGFGEKDFKGNKVSDFNSSYARGFLYGNLGVEVIYKISEKYLLGLNPGLRVGVADAYPDGDFYFNFKVGRTF